MLFHDEVAKFDVWSRHNVSQCNVLQCFKMFHKRLLKQIVIIIIEASPEEFFKISNVAKRGSKKREKLTLEIMSKSNPVHL